jgi:hypothetical protein
MTSCEQCEYRGALRWFPDRELIYCTKYKEWVDIKKPHEDCNNDLD